MIPILETIREARHQFPHHMIVHGFDGPFLYSKHHIQKTCKHSPQITDKLSRYSPLQAPHSKELQALNQNYWPTFQILWTNRVKNWTATLGGILISFRFTFSCSNEDVVQSNQNVKVARNGLFSTTAGEGPLLNFLGPLSKFWVPKSLRWDFWTIRVDVFWGPHGPSLEIESQFFKLSLLGVHNPFVLVVVIDVNVLSSCTTSIFAPRRCPYCLRLGMWCHKPRSQSWLLSSVGQFDMDTALPQEAKVGTLPFCADVRDEAAQQEVSLERPGPDGADYPWWETWCTASQTQVQEFYHSARHGWNQACLVQFSHMLWSSLMNGRHCQTVKAMVS